MPKHYRKRGKNALDADDIEWLENHHRDEADEDGPPEGDRWSTWDLSVPTERGPRPYPGWLVTELAAVDTELGVLKTGKEADVHLISRGVPGTGRQCLLAAKRYRSGEHRLFHRDAGYLEGRRMRDSRMSRAMAGRTAFGKQVIAGQWAGAEFAALTRLFELGLPVPYPVQIVGTEVLEEFIGTPDGYAAPRLANVSDDLPGLWEQLVDAMVRLAHEGLAHGDLSPYNILVHEGRLVIIDLPQIVDVISHPAGPEFLDRDARNVATWFAGKGLPQADPDGLAALLRAEARVS
ncbi:serine protein kinase RIO [Nonomuraea sp. NPDC050394]|uniref:serine protein kinase RIO n=1 Tax=Nonomuraea sp. NPDC050394 TaxID=3364363 RepID=UPI0037AB6D26